VERTFPHWTILPGAIFVSACFVARRRTSPDLAWGLFTIAWLIALIQATRSLLLSIAVISGPPPVSELQRGLLTAYVSNLALPLFLSLPAACYAIKGSRGARSYGRNWIIVCSLVGLIDVTVLTVSLFVVIGYTWRW
jgi:hypothetical protein